LRRQLRPGEAQLRRWRDRRRFHPVKPEPHDLRINDGPIRRERGPFKAARIERVAHRFASQGSGDQKRVGLLKEQSTLSTFAARRVAAHEFGSFDIIGWREVKLREVQAGLQWDKRAAASEVSPAPPSAGVPQAKAFSSALITFR
jgi:hypothetical protein